MSPDTNEHRDAGYRTCTKTLIVGDEPLRIRALLDRQQFSDPDGEAARLGITSATWPIFGMIWPSALVLSSHLAPISIAPGCRVLEAGCGLALASLVLHRRGIDITASDVHPLVREFLRHNLLLNDLPPMRYAPGDWNAASKAPDAPDAADAFGAPGVLGLFDLIIGSDLLYDRDQPAQLAGFIARHATPVAQVILVDPDRGNRNAFTRAIGEAGFALAEERRVTELPGSGGPYKGRVLVYQR